jgi:hypothetical protein
MTRDYVLGAPTSGKAPRRPSCRHCSGGRLGSPSLLVPKPMHGVYQDIVKKCDATRCLVVPGAIQVLGLSKLLNLSTILSTKALPLKRMLRL